MKPSYTEPAPDDGAAESPIPPDRPGEPARRSHDEWLIDEALGETFPASDPVSPAQTGVPRPPR